MNIKNEYGVQIYIYNIQKIESFILIYTIFIYIQKESMVYLYMKSFILIYTINNKGSKE